MTAMPAMTAETEEWLTLLQQIIGNSPMGIMAEIAILLYRCMFIEKGSLFFGMALIAKGINVHLCQNLRLRTMGSMTVRTFHFTFPDGMV
jgi:hypothetical protein